MKNLLLFLILPCLVFSQEDTLNVYGTITDTESTGTLAKVRVEVKGTSESTETDSQGRYNIQAKPGDILMFKRVGMETIEIIAEDVTSLLNIEMRPKTERLDEVVVRKKGIKTQKELEREFAANKRLIRTYYGILDADRVGYTMRVMDGDDFTLGFVDVLDVLQARFPGIYTLGSPEAVGFRKAYLNRTRTLNGNVPLIYEIDGVVTGDLPFIPVTEIDRLAVISGTGGTLRYGIRGAGGVVVINTKRGVAMYEKSAASKLGIPEFNSSDLVDYEESEMFGDFVNSMSLENALNKLEILKSSPRTSAYTYLQAYTYFQRKWPNQSAKEEILDLILEKHSNDPVVMKSLAYILEDLNEFDTALEVYQQLFEIRPDYEQSYRDVANAYQQTGDPKTALRFYMNKDGFPRFDEKSSQNREGIDFIMLTELNALLKNNLTELGIENKKNLGKVPNGTRLLFEWSHGEAEFEVQLVNPKKRYFTWTHENIKDKERIRDEKLRGYSSKQFFLDNDLQGNWQVNLKYFGNKSAVPTYLKVTLWTNFGTAFENRMMKLFRLENKDDNYKLASFVNSPLVAENQGK
ncbi:carboxypeptidase-like regulatory domain-containing protein [Flagellimonas sp. 2504JD1-5]